MNRIEKKEILLNAFGKKIAIIPASEFDKFISLLDEKMIAQIQKGDYRSDTYMHVIDPNDVEIDSNFESVIVPVTIGFSEFIADPKSFEISIEMERDIEQDLADKYADVNLIFDVMSDVNYDKEEITFTINISTDHSSDGRYYV